MRDVIVCLVGESGSGKSTIGELLEKEGFNYIQSKTTRKPRFQSEKGHIFTHDEEYRFDKKNKWVIAETIFDGNRYWITNDLIKKGTNIYVIDPAGVKTLKQNLENCEIEIVVIYLRCDELRRIRRMTERKHGKDEFFGFLLDDDIRDRVKHDKEAFKIVECNYCIDANKEVNEVLKDVKSIIDSLNLNI